MHGGKSPQALRKAEERISLNIIREAVNGLGLKADVTDAQTVLLDELQRCAAAVAWLDVQVNALKANQIVWGKTREKVGGEDHGRTHEAGTNAMVRLWQEERDRLVRVSKACLDAGIAERLVELEADRVRLIAMAMGRALDAADLTPVQRDTVTTVMIAQLRSHIAPEGDTQP